MEPPHWQNKQKENQPGLELTTAAGNSKKGQNPTNNHQCTATNKTVSNTITRRGLPLAWATAPVVKEKRNTELTQGTVWGHLEHLQFKRKKERKENQIYN